MRKLQHFNLKDVKQAFFAFALLLLSVSFTNAQCNAVNGEISGNVFLDKNVNGINDDDSFLSGVLVNAFDEDGNLADHAISNLFGNYTLDELDESKSYRIEFKYAPTYYQTQLGLDHKSELRHELGASCNINFGLVTEASLIGDNPDLAITCFVQGENGTNDDKETIVGIESQFFSSTTSSTPAYPIMSKGQTGSVWGLAFDKKQQNLYSAAFIKQYAELGSGGMDAIYITSMKTQPYTVSTFVKLSELGINMPSLAQTDVVDCTYGVQVGKTGLGGMEISPNGKKLYIINISNNSLVSLNTNNPSDETTEEIIIPTHPNYTNQAAYPFAIKYYNDKLYIGVTITGEEAGNSSATRAFIYEYDLDTQTFNVVFETNYIAGPWQDNDFDSYAVQQWLTDIDFISDDFMVIGITDRKGHKYCDSPSNRLDDQKGDVLAVYKDNDGHWTLEKNAMIFDNQMGSGRDNGDGPKDANNVSGEFFGHDYFPKQADYHNEVALGSIAVLPNTKEVVATTFDPYWTNYSGGLQRYTSSNGNIAGFGNTFTGAKDLYLDDHQTLFGKATGFGDVIIMASNPGLEIGNVVWIDGNKNGIQDPSETVLPNIQVALYDANCNKVGETITNNDGHYKFNNTNVDLDGNQIMDGLDPYTTYHIVITDPSFNKAQSSFDYNGNLFVLTKVNSGHQSNPDGTDNDATLAKDMCSEMDGLPMISMTTKGLGENDHSFDFGFSSPGDFDLALKKEIVGNDLVRVNDKITFKITVINQGDVGAKDIKVHDLIPDGLRYVQADNDGWELTDNVAEFIIDELSAKTETEIFIHLFINGGFTYDHFINYAEISEAKNQFGLPGQDIDSTPDNDFTNDEGGVPFQVTDNEVADDGTIDEDDHDPAAPRVFDLALTKRLVNVQSTYVEGDVADFEIYVWNQGNELAKNVTIIDYVPEGLEVDGSDGWTQSSGKWVYTIDEVPVGQRITVPISLAINNASDITTIVNKAEIVIAHLENDQIAVDFDSNANDNELDDKGGNPYDSTDDEKFDSGEIDEDDHDPALFNLSRFDLALMKTTDVHSVTAGKSVEFDIKVINQGTIIADEIEVTDYIPEALEFLDSNEDWELNGDQAYCTLSVENGLLPANGLLPGADATISITLKVKDTADPGTLVNVAEISSAKDIEGNDRSDDDFDSHPDKFVDNDMGGEIMTNTDDLVTDNGAIDEDDQDPAALQVLAFGLNVSCVCVANSTDTNVGQFVNTVYVITDVAERWTVVSATNFEQGNGSASTAPNYNYPAGQEIITNPFPTGPISDSIYGIDIGGVLFLYDLEGITRDGEAYSVTVTNGVDTLTIDGNACEYSSQSIEGPTGICVGSTATYCAENLAVQDYSWSIDGDGIIVGADDEACITVEWGTSAGGPYTVILENDNTNDCTAVATVEVQLGVSGGAMACIGDANIALDSDCTLEVTPELVLQGAVPADAVYDVIVMDPQGNMLAEPIITGDHIGVPMTIKVVDVCTGNSCWSSITVNDNIAPIVVAQDVTIDCNDMTSLALPTATDNCFVLSSTDDITLVGESNENLDCDPDYTNIITKRFVAIDDEGNVSDTVDQQIFLERIDLSLIVFPENRTVQNNNPLFCQQFGLDDEGNPSTADAGVPTYKGQSIFPYQDEFCSFGIDYTDQVVQPNGCVQKIMRTWTAFEWWCGQAIVETSIQEINIADQLAPVFAAPANITVTTNTGSCFATVNLPAVAPIDDCSEMFEVDIQYPGGFLNNSNGGNVDFSLGESLVTYTVYDGCLNSSMQSFSVTVVDNTAPVMVCDQNTVISLKADGTAYAPANVFDDGTIEDCSPFTLEVRRMDNGAACGANNSAFGEFVEFCCADAGQTVQVILKATDADGNSNECMVNVVIQDKNPPIITVPADLTIQCTDPWNEENLEAFFGAATATDNCQVTDIDEVYSININDCNVGTIVRTFTATDGNGTDIGTQIITVENNSVFDQNDIVWPLDFSTDAGCNAGDLSPESLDPPFDFPVITTDECDMVEFAYTEQTFQTTDNDACLKIIRTWMVMDMCNLDMAGNPTMFLHDQTIVVTNSVAPVILTSCEPVSSSQFADCDEAFIELSASAEDDCTPTDMLQWSYNIDLNQDGSFEVNETGTGGEIAVSGLFPLGTHTIVYQWEDRCGNPVNCSQEFTLFNEVLPIAYCQDLTVELTPMDTDGDNIPDAEMAFVDVDLIGGTSEHPCGLPIEISYDAAGDSTLATFDCFDLGFNDITIFVTDQFGNQSSCVATIEIQDNNNVDICPTVEDCIVWPDTNLVISTCVANLDPATIMSEASVSLPCVCEDFDITFNDVDVSNPNDACVDLERTWMITFNCFSSPMEFTFLQTINQQNASAPIIDTCPADGVGMASDATCTAEVIVGVPTVLGVGECSFGIVITNDSPFADSNNGSASGTYPVGTQDVIYTVTDLCENSSTCTIQIVVDDEGAPICNTQDITVSIPASGGSITIANDAVDNNSTDDCGMIVSYAVTPNTFTCDDLGPNTVVMTVTDQSGNSSTCEATVTVQDLVAPICVAQPLEITLFVDAPITIAASQVDGGSTDTCGTVVLLEVFPNTFDCSNAGENTVTLTVTDDSGNTSQCTTTVTVLDGVAPTCNAQDITVSIPASGGSVTIAGDAVDNGSTDVCGSIATYETTPNTFTCDDLGPNTVVMTVTDGNGNSSTCEATVTVEDLVAPICVAVPLDITLTDNTPITITADQIDGGSMDTCGTVVLLEVSPDTFDCSNAGANTVTLTVTDNAGNTSQCTTTVTIIDGVAPLCVSQDITVTLDAMGSAMIVGADVDGGSTDVCGDQVSFSVTPDTFTCDDIGENTVTLTVTDGSGNTSECTAIVTVVDETAPTCVPGTANITLFAATEISIPASFVDAGSFDSCGEIDTIFITPDLFGCDDIGANTVILTVVDNSGNSSTCEATVNVSDNVAPECVVQDITIMIETDGTTTVAGIDLDNGSSDACGEIVSYEVTPNTFDCTNEGDNAVVFTVTDNSGNTCTADAIVTVESAGELMCNTQDLTIYLDETGSVSITPEEVDNGSMAPCGASITLSLSKSDFACNDAQSNPTTIMFFATDDNSGEVDTCFSDITVLDTLVPVVICPDDLTFDCTQDLSNPTIFGLVDFDDNCPGALMMDTIIVDNRNSCGIGTIERTYVAMDLSGNMGECTQIITVENAAGMDFAEANIIWPDTTIMVLDCSMTSPEELMSFPTINSTGLGCFNVSIDFVDMSIGMSSMCLDTIQRTWTVIDSCQLDGMGAGVFMFDQFLFVDDSDIPLIMGLPTDTTLFVGPDSCDLFVDLSAVFVDDCSMVITGTNDSPFSGNANSLDASGEYPLGTTTVTITSADACGNADTFMININLLDTIAPVMNCVKTFPQITDNGTVVLTPQEVLGSLSDNCTDSVGMTPLFILDFTEDDTDPTDNTTATSLTFDCDDLGINIVYLIAFDESGNFTFCAAQSAVEDPNEFCGPLPAGGAVSGEVKTHHGEPVGKTEMSLTGNSNNEVDTELDGTFAFGNLYGLGLFKLTPYNDNNHLEGVSTLDILIIQKHIMGMDELDNPYDLIAADANKSDDITGADIITLQKLILGDYQSFPENTSFRFVSPQQAFIDGNPFITTYEEHLEWYGITEDKVRNFTGIKIGDVNGSYHSGGFQGDIDITTRNIEHSLYMNKEIINPVDGIIEIPVYSDDFEALQALEMTLEFNSTSLIDVKPGKVDLTIADFAIRNEGRELKVSWVNTLPINLTERAELFTLVFQSEESLFASDVISMTNSINEFYRGNYDIATLRFNHGKVEERLPKIVLNQNTPNPWTNQTTLSFEMFKDAEYKINFYAADGKLIHTAIGMGQEGENLLTLEKTDFDGVSGVIMYEFISGNRKLVKRMILIE